MKEELITGNNSVRQSPVKRLPLDGLCVESGGRSRTSCKRIKPTQINGYIVYTRRTKFKKLNEESGNAGLVPKPISSVIDSSVDICHNESLVETNIRESCYIYTRRKKRIKFGKLNEEDGNAGLEPKPTSSVIDSSGDIIAETEKPAGKIAMEERLVSATGRLDENVATEKFKEPNVGSSLVDVVIDDLKFVEMLHEEIPVEILPEGSLDYELKRVRSNKRTVGKSYCALSVENRNRSLKRTTQIYKSVLRMKKVNSLVPEDVEALAERDVVCEGLDEQTPSVSLTDKSSIVIYKRPTTARELLETGLLDGLPVVYMGTYKSQASRLRGIIKDGGILCSCYLCDWSKVISPSNFEVHANKQYKRASQYICFENGKSLLDVLNICRNTLLPKLKETILDVVSVSKEKYFTCKGCKGMFSLSSVGRRGFQCLSCSKVEDSESTSKSTVWLSSPRPKALRQGLVGKGYLSATTNISSHKKFRSKFNMSTQYPVATKALNSMSISVSSKKRSFRSMRKDQRLHKMVFERGGLPDGTELGYYVRGQKLLGGHKKGAGIYCYCCNSEVCPSAFEAHAGSSRRKPYYYIYTTNGVSLHEWAITFSQGRQYSANENDNLCVICADGGNLLLCDSCPRAFHIECVSLPSIPRSNWHCKYCEKKSKSETDGGEYNETGQQLEGVDPVDNQLAGRCIRVVKNMEAEVNGCVLCSGSDFCRSGFGPRTIIICDQCEKEFHIGCLSSHDIVDLKELPKGNWFCSVDCTKINSALQILLLGEAEKVSESCLEILEMKKERNGEDHTVSPLDIRWRLINGKVTSPESRILLSQALAIFHDCFDPIVDPISGRNLIPRMVYGKNMQGQDYGGICCAVLTINATVVSAGLLRLFGKEVAELPLVATRVCSREKGYFQLLFSCIEKLLSFLNIESIVLPAAEEAEPLWINKFGFTKLEPEQFGKYIKMGCQMVRFKGSSMLHKVVHSHQIVNTDTGESLEENFDLKQPEEFVHGEIKQVTDFV